MKTILTPALITLCCFFSPVWAHTTSQSDTTQFEPQHFKVRTIGQGQPLLLIPGLMSDARVWQPIQAELAEQFELHLIEVRGFGETPPPGDAALVEPGWLRALHDELGAYLQAYDLQQVSVIGHSLGGFLGMALAIDNPERVTRVVSIDGVPYLAPLFTRDVNTQVADMRGNAEQMLAYYRSLNTAEALGATVAQGVTIHAASEADQQRVIEMSAQSDAAVVAVATHDMLQWDLREGLADLDAPLLLLGATGALPEHMQDQATELYTQQLENLPLNDKEQILKINRASRHFIMFDDAEWLSAQILGFLQ